MAVIWQPRRTPAASPHLHRTAAPPGATRDPAAVSGPIHPGDSGSDGPRPEPSSKNGNPGGSRVEASVLGTGCEICSRPPTLSTIRHRASTMSDDGMNIDDGMFSHHFILAPYSLPIHPGGVVRRKGRGFQSAAGMFE